MRYFIDTEFDGTGGPLLSMALVRDDGRSIYFYDPEACANVQQPWVADNVVPILRDSPEPPTPRHAVSMAHAVEDFMAGDECPHVVADWPADIAYLCALLDLGGGTMVNIPGISFEVKRIDAYPTTLEGAVQHNAWWDALALRQKVLELEDALGHAEPPQTQAEIGSIKTGDVVCLKSGGHHMTVIDMFAPVLELPPAASVAWMDDAGELRSNSLPISALLRL